MDSRKLEILMTAVDLGSLSRAAEVVGYTQSGLTHLVDSLEREIGLTLVQRDHSGIALTEEGNALMPAIREFLRANARLENQISAITEKSAQTIRVAAYASIAMRWMPEILYRFRRVCPHIDVDLRTVDHELEPFELLEAWRTDVIFAARQSAFACDWTPLHNDAMYAILPADYPTGRPRDVPNHGIRGSGLPDALWPVRYRRGRGVPEIRREACHPPLPRRRRDGHPHGRQGAWNLDDGGDDAPRQAERCEDAPGQPERQPRTRHGPAPGGHLPEGIARLRECVLEFIGEL